MDETADSRLYVGNIPYDTTKEDLTAHFAQAGAVVECHIPMDRETGRVRGFAFVTMENKRGADEGVKLTHGMEFCGRTLRVNVALPRGERAPRYDNGGGGGGGGGGFQDRGGGGGGGGYQQDRGPPPQQQRYAEERPRYEQAPRYDDRAPPPRYDDRAPPRYAEERPRYADERPRYDDRAPPRYADERPRYDDRAPPRYEPAPRYADERPRYDERAPAPQYADERAPAPRYADERAPAAPRYDDRYDRAAPPAEQGAGAGAGYRSDAPPARQQDYQAPAYEERRY